jgi:hypothetical protein
MRNICVTNDHGYFKFIIITIGSFPHSWPIIGFVTRVTRRVPLIEKELPLFRSTLGHPRCLVVCMLLNTNVFSYLCSVFYVSLFVLFYWSLYCLYFLLVIVLFVFSIGHCIVCIFYWSLYCLYYLSFHLQFLITPLVSSNFSLNWLTNDEWRVS